MKTFNLLLLTFLFLSVRVEAGADGAGREPSAPRLSLSEVERAVTERNPAIKEALARWKAAKQRVTEEAAWDDPRVSGTSRVRRYVDVPPDAFTDQTLSIEQAIPISGKNRARARVATAEAIVAFEEVRRQELDTLQKARASYFHLANAYAQIELNHRNYTSLTQIAEINRSRYEAGTQNVADVLMSETDAAKLLETRRDLERNVANAQSQLNVLMNRDAFAPVAAPQELAMPEVHFTADALRDLTRNHRPEVRAAQARLAGEQAKVQLAHRAWIPDPAVKLEGQRYNESARDLSELDAGISFSVPWGNARKYSAGVAEANATADAAKAALTRAETEAIGGLRDALQKLETAHHHVELFRDKLVPQARQAFESSQFAYESGKATFADWISAQRTLRDLEAEAREHLTDYQIALAELESVVGASLHIFPTTTNRDSK